MKTFLRIICLLLLVTPFLTTTAQFTFDSRTPAANANNIALDATIVLNFSAAAKAWLITASNIRIKGRTACIISGTYTLSVQFFFVS